MKGYTTGHYGHYPLISAVLYQEKSTKAEIWIHVTKWQRVLIITEVKKTCISLITEIKSLHSKKKSFQRSYIMETVLNCATAYDTSRLVINQVKSNSLEKLEYLNKYFLFPLLFISYNSLKHLCYFLILCLHSVLLHRN